MVSSKFCIVEKASMGELAFFMNVKTIDESMRCGSSCHSGEMLTNYRHLQSGLSLD
jgi:hypothetical protein